MFEVWPEIQGVVQQQHVLQVTYRAQLTKVSCWAAVAQMVLQSMGVWASSYNDQSAVFDAYDKDGANSLATALQGRGVTGRYVNASLEFADVQHAVNGGAPLVYDLDFNTPTTHVGVIAGYGVTQGGEQWIYILDPDDLVFRSRGSSPFGWIRFGAIKNPAVAGMTWGGTYYDLRRV